MRQHRLPVRPKVTGYVCLCATGPVAACVRQSRTLNTSELMRQPDILVCHPTKHTHTELNGRSLRRVHAAVQSADVVVQVCRPTLQAVKKLCLFVSLCVRQGAKVASALTLASWLSKIIPCFVFLVVLFGEKLPQFKCFRFVAVRHCKS